MKNKNQRDLQKHWAEQARKKTPAEQLRAKAEKLREKIAKDSGAPGGNQQDTAPKAGSSPESSSNSKRTKNAPPAGNNRAN
jgi:hypothetical protein